MNPALMVKLAQEPLASTVSAPVNISREEAEVATKLASILANPTEDQKVILDTIKALLADTTRVKEDAANKANSELKKAEDDLLNAVANILLTGAMPDLIKKGDVANIKAIFTELDSVKNRIMLEYNESAKPYYDNIIKDLAKNMPMLQLKNILSPSMTKDELEKLPPSELDKLLEKIKQQKNKDFETEYLLQQEVKYHKLYIEPSKQKLEDSMKEMLVKFTSRINDTLKSTESAKK